MNICRLKVMIKMEFRRRHDDGRVFPIGEGREHRVIDDYQPPEESEDKTSYEESEAEYEASVKEEEEQKKEEEEEKERKRREKELRKAENPSYFTKANAKSDVKHLMRADDSKADKQKNFDRYKQRLDRSVNLTHIKEDEKADRRREKAISKAEKYEEKAEKLKTQIGET